MRGDIHEDCFSQVHVTHFGSLRAWPPNRKNSVIWRHNRACYSSLTKNGIDYIEELLKKGCKQKHFALMSGGFSDADRERGTRLGCGLFEKLLEMDALAKWVESVEKIISAERRLFDWACGDVA